VCAGIIVVSFLRWSSVVVLPKFLLVIHLSKMVTTFCMAIKSIRHPPSCGVPFLWDSSRLISWAHKLAGRLGLFAQKQMADLVSLAVDGVIMLGVAAVVLVSISVWGGSSLTCGFLQKQMLSKVCCLDLCAVL
jgi:hypothetical protein